MKTCRVFCVSGRVQGVAFRVNAYAEARRLALTGWVRNLPDGRVELEAEGSRPLLDELLAALRQGPRHATVSAIAETWGPPRNAESDFTIR